MRAAGLTFLGLLLLGAFRLGVVFLDAPFPELVNILPGAAIENQPLDRNPIIPENTYVALKLWGAFCICSFT